MTRSRLFQPLVAGSEESALVFLDGHFSGPKTGRGELVSRPSRSSTASVRRRAAADLTVVVDDVRLFGREPGFPSLERLLLRVHAERLSGAELWIDKTRS